MEEHEWRWEAGVAEEPQLRGAAGHGPDKDEQGGGGTSGQWWESCAANANVFPVGGREGSGGRGRPGGGRGVDEDGEEEKEEEER